MMFIARAMVEYPDSPCAGSRRTRTQQESCDEHQGPYCRHLVSGKKRRIWAEMLPDDHTFADSVTDFHDLAKFERSVPDGPANRQAALRGPLDSGWGSGRHRFAAPGG